jgi:chemotaxis protein methyltransferase CheR
MAVLGLADAAAYRLRLETHPEEWAVLDQLSGVTISRFYRDRALWSGLQNEVLPALIDAAIAAGDDELRCWSVGCASGEEPYTLSILWSLGLSERVRGLRLRIVATDVNEDVLARARDATYEAGSLRDLPPEWITEAFEPQDGRFRVRERFVRPVELRRSDVRRELPEQMFRLVLCRNVVVTYFADDLQRATLERIQTKLSPGGAIVLGGHEKLPAGVSLEPWMPTLGISRARVSRGP